MTANGKLSWRTVQRRIGDFVEWEKNPRVLTEKRAEDLRRSLDRFGYVEEIVLNADGVSMIGGHQRRRVLLAQAMLDPDALVDVRIPSRQLTPAEAMELAIRLNKNTGEWDFDILANEFEEQALFDWGFTTMDFGQGLPLATDDAEATAPGEDGEEDGEDKGRRALEGPFPVDKACELLEPLLPRWETCEEWAAEITTLPLAMMQFNALCAGYAGSVGNTISLNFNPQRLDVVCLPGKLGPLTALRKSVEVRRLVALYCASLLRHHANAVLSGLYLGSGGVRIANEFWPSVARDIYKRLLEGRERPRVLDPCHGWGGRLVGFMACGIEGAHYVGVDPERRVHKGLGKLYDFLKESGVSPTAEFIRSPFEDTKLEKDSYDLIFTSPPYFDTEIYSNEKTQSAVRYPTFDAWVEGFLAQLIKGSVAACAHGGTIALNVGNRRYPLMDKSVELLKAEGLEPRVETIAHLKRGVLGGAEDEGESLVLASKP